MQFIFCSSPMEQGKPDELYELEAAAVKKLDPSSSLINFEAMADENNSVKAVRRVPERVSENDLAVYRGWMLSPVKYKLLYDALRSRGVHLINDPESYKHCHYLPEWLHIFDGQTPQSVWLDKASLSDNLIDAVMDKLVVFGSSPVIVKDYVKSEKHRWDEACFIPDPSDREHTQRVVLKFLELRGSNLEGGLVFRKFVNFKALATHSKSGMPLTKEFRLFVLDGTIIHWFNYWEEGNYGDSVPPLDYFADAAKKPLSRFFTMDIAQTEDDEWLIVELGDGQVAGLPENADVDAFYRSLSEQLSRPQ
ncbi:MAG: ATP-grasp domain-containing protein [Cyanobacteria bacterium SZAS TMP-1]|nr:ATP-grasp domain-containing protein [Cyanobacteria bacterium SZAS TMP-1]